MGFIHGHKQGRGYAAASASCGGGERVQPFEERELHRTNEPTHVGLCKLALAEGFTVRAEAGFPLWSQGLAGGGLLFCGASFLFFFFFLALLTWQ